MSAGTLRAAVVGNGRMGQAIIRLLSERGHRVIARIGRGDDLGAAADADVAFEFSRPEAAEANVRHLVAAGVPTVCGTTGWAPEGIADEAAAAGVPVLFAANFSLGVAILEHLVAEACRLARAFPQLAVGIVEHHHAGKVDAPSGTALVLARRAASAVGNNDLPPIASLRCGAAPGEHRVILDGGDEHLELVHQARSRNLFAAGAVVAGEWLVARRPGGGLVPFSTVFEENTR